MAYSSGNVVSGNKVNVTSKLNRTVSPFNSTNSIVGIDSYYDCQNNVFSGNDIYVKANDNYIYGMGVLGYMTGHTAPEGHGAIDNQFIGNKITLEGTYFVQGIVIGSSSEGTIVQNNIVNVKSSNVAYGINLEASQESNIIKNTFTLNSDAVYCLEAFTSNGNTIDSNNFDANGKQVYGIVFSSSNNNNVTKNKISAMGTGEPIGINLDSIPAGNAGMFLKSTSTNNTIKENNITSLKGYAIIVDNEAVDNEISKNYLDSEKGFGNNAINNTKINIIDGNYRYTFNVKLNDVTANYLEILTVSMDIDSGSFVKFFIIEKTTDNVIKEIGNTTSVNGKATVNYRMDVGKGKVRIKAVYSKENYLEAESIASLTINAGTPVVSFDDVSASTGGKANLIATVKDDLGRGVSGVTVKFYRVINGKYTMLGSTTTNSLGVAQKEVNMRGYDPGAYVISANITGMNFNAISKQAIMTVSADGIKVKFDDISANALSSVTFTATVTNANNNGVSGVNVDFYKLNELVGSAITDNNGVASLVVDNIPYAVGNYVISANVAGSGISPISKQANLKVNAAQAYIKLFSKVYSNGVLAKIMDAYGNPLSNKQVMFKVGETEYNVITDADGTIKMPNVAHGKYAITISFGGDNIYKAKKILYSTTVMPAIVDNNDYTVYYGNSIDYKVRIVGSDGNYVGANNVVTMNVGKVSYELSTDENGYVSKFLDLNPGVYVVSCEYNGDKVSNSIIVKPILEFTSVNQNNGDVTISVKLTNPSTGKAWANEEIAFKLNGKLYFALSNKNGIAALSVYNLDVGKYAICSEYGGCTIKNKIQIK